MSAYVQKSFIFSLMFFFLLGGCAPYSQDAGSIGKSQEYRVAYGVVHSMKPITINSEGGATAGAITGGVLGAVLGSLIGGGTGKVLASVGGAALGAAGGGLVGNKVGGHKAYEITVNGDDGRVFSIIEHQSVNVSVGQRVRLLLGSDFSRIEPL